MRSRRCVLVPLVLTATSALAGQEITRANYYDYLPPFPRIVAATRASERFRLYGDTADPRYVDVNPRDGIDDVRERTLLRLAERFAPILRPNNFSRPRDLQAILGPSWPLMVDAWTADGTLAGSDSIVVGADSSAADARLLALLRRTSPMRPRRTWAAAEGEIDTVLFVDLPGAEASSWRAAYLRREWSGPSRIFAHVFIAADSSPHADAGSALVVQYWFFYPFNDAVNEHEGDWEHINVMLTPRAWRPADVPIAPIPGSFLLDSATIDRVLAGNDAAIDSLAIGAVDYYFHQNFIRLDYLGLAADEGDRSAAADRRYFWEDVGFVRRALAARLGAAHGRLATHPLVFVGGNNKGPDELLSPLPRFRASFKRNSGSSYPFPGTWQTVAGFGVTETVNGRITPRAVDDSTRSYDAVIRDPEFVTYPHGTIRLLPDWERVEGLVLAEQAARRDWAWLVLPMYWGFPATASPGAGLVAHADLGNVAPPGPAFNDGWNRIGGPPRARYNLRVLRTPVSPTTPWANLRSGWGLLNVPFAVWGLMPGYNVGVIQLTPWIEGAAQFVGAPPPRTFTPGRLPRRFTSEGQGVAWMLGGGDYAALLPQRDPVVDAARAGHPGSAIDPRSARRLPSVAPALWFDLYFGERFALENSYSWSQGPVEYLIRMPNGGRAAAVTGTLKLAELSGGVSYAVGRVGTGLFEPHLRAGYGWTRYSVERVAVEGTPTVTHGVHGGYLPPLLPSSKWWPNTLYGGADVELFTSRRRYLLRRLGYGVRLDATFHVTRVGSDADGGRRVRSARRGTLAVVTHFGW